MGDVKKGLETSVLNKHHRHAFTDTVTISNIQEAGKGRTEKHILEITSS